MSSVQRKARKDAREFARAQMFYGEGAGTRRKLVQATVDARSHADPAYARAFRQELNDQDMADHAAKARRERKRVDVTESVQKNIKGLATGNTNSISTGVLVVTSVAYVAHATGADVVIWDHTKNLYRKTKRAIKNGLHGQKPSHDNVYDITNVKR